MSISTAEAFELGFLQHCADAGLSAGQTQLMLKRASALLKSGTAFDMLSKYVNEHVLQHGAPKQDWRKGLGLALGLGVGVPMALGGTAGYAARRLQGDFLDPEDVKKQELINEYKTQARRAQQPQAAFGL